MAKIKAIHFSPEVVLENGRHRHERLVASDEPFEAEVRDQVVHVRIPKREQHFAVAVARCTLEYEYVPAPAPEQLPSQGDPKAPAGKFKTGGG